MNKILNFNRNNISRRRPNRPSLGGGRLNYKNVSLLRQFITAQGKILSRPVSKLTSKQQRTMAKFIKYARILAFLPFVSNDL
jgi:small subunit ribosomal protein S18